LIDGVIDEVLAGVGATAAQPQSDPPLHWRWFER